METTSNPNNPPETIEFKPEMPPLPSEAEKPSRKFPLIVLIPLVVIVSGMLVLWLMGWLGRPTPTSLVAPTRAPSLPTPTPERPLSAVASQSAFLALESHVASLSAGITNFILEDPTLTPPVLDLPLGF